MKRYQVNTPFVGIRLCSSSDTETGGVMSSLPREAIIETRGPSSLGTGMIEVSWGHHRYVVFELDLTERASLLSAQAAGH
jgi:hypothetical protein